MQATLPMKGLPLQTGTRTLASRRAGNVVCRAQNKDSQKNTEFGYSRKDVILIGGGLIGLGYAGYYGLQAAGLDAGIAGNFVQAAVFLGICIYWIGTYLYRVATKKMTYVQQLKDYEDAVMAKRLEEMPDAELETIVSEIEAEKQQKKK